MPRAGLGFVGRGRSAPSPPATGSGGALSAPLAGSSGVTMGWLLRLVTGGPSGSRGPPTVLELFVIKFSVCMIFATH